MNADALLVLNAIKVLPKRHTAFDLWQITGLSLNRIHYARKSLLKTGLITCDRTGSRVPLYALTSKGREL